jgi:hypothetical protein
VCGLASSVAILIAGPPILLYADRSGISTAANDRQSGLHEARSATDL